MKQNLKKLALAFLITMLTAFMSCNIAVDDTGDEDAAGQTQNGQATGDDNDQNDSNQDVAQIANVVVIDGTLLDEGGAPLAGAKVSLEDRALKITRAGSAESITDSNGHYTIDLEITDELAVASKI